jgi:hypothetical protein
MGLSINVIGLLEDSNAPLNVVLLTFSSSFSENFFTGKNTDIEDITAIKPAIGVLFSSKYIPTTIKTNPNKTLNFINSP